MSRAYGWNAKLLIAEESTYGTLSSGPYTQVPFASSAIDSEQGLISSNVLGLGRDPTTPFQDVINVEGDLAVPVDLRNIGIWLKTVFGVPETTNENGVYTHTFESGKTTLPSYSLELGLAEVPEFIRFLGARANSIAFNFARSGEAQATVSLMAQSETASETSVSDAPEVKNYTRFSQFQGFIKSGGETLANVTSASVTYSNKTLLKLNEFDEHIAKELKTNIETKTLDSLFSFTFNCEDGISFNKRGSGIKRLMLLSFFLAEAERKNISKNIIYAIEEPETSQHPDFQIMLMNALKDLSDSGNRQILLTTHTPEIVKMINKEDLIFIQKDHENHMISVETNDDIEISKVADTLGILPFVSYKGVIFVEGKTDIRFLKNLSKIDEFRSIIDLTHFTFIELHGGGNIDLWIKANYLSGTNIKCLYFRDRDTSTTPPSVVHPQKVIITSKREIENYIPISSIEEKFDVTFTPYEIEHWNDMDVANSLYNKGIRFGNDQKHSENVIKQILQGQNIWNQIILSPENRSEIQDWFQQMKDFFEDAGW